MANTYLSQISENNKNNDSNKHYNYTRRHKVHNIFKLWHFQTGVRQVS